PGRPRALRPAAGLTPGFHTPKLPKELRPMDKRFLRAALAFACLCGAVSAVSAQQSQGRRTGGGGLDNMSLPSTLERAAGERWPTFAPEGEGFSVAMPGKPVDVAAEKRAGGLADARSRRYVVKADGIVYEVTRTGQIPAALFEVRGFEQDFLASLAGSLPASARNEWPHMKLELSEQQPTALDGVAGREFDLSSADHRARARFRR
ncbi:MAG TPA: hypothetical protein VF240_06325, partial [Pyrinomonadaceae bacterium]